MMPHKLDPIELSQRLIDLAKIDGVISNDEQAIIDNVKDNIEKYFQVLKESFDDDVITSDEQNSMYEIRKKIMEDALKTAKKDEKISQDEFALLGKIRDILEELEYNEHY